MAWGLVAGTFVSLATTPCIPGALDDLERAPQRLTPAKEGLVRGVRKFAKGLRKALGGAAERIRRVVAIRGR